MRLHLFNRSGQEIRKPKQLGPVTRMKEEGIVEGLRRIAREAMAAERGTGSGVVEGRILFEDRDYDALWGYARKLYGPNETPGRLLRMLMCNQFQINGQRIFDKHENRHLFLAFAI